jgi:hypothetical protein
MKKWLKPPAKDLFLFRSRFWPWLAVLTILLFAGFIRVRLLEMPLERDEGEYAYAGQLILQGIPPYELAYNMKLPGTYCAYALGMAVFGQSTAGVHLTLLVANSLTIVFIFLFGRQLLGVTTGLVAAATYGIMSVSPAVLGLAAHATHFVVLFAVPGVWWLWRAAESGRRRAVFFSGLWLGLAFLMKQQGICFGMFGVAFLAWRAGRSGNFVSECFLKQILCFGAGLILPLGLTCLCLAAAGVFPKFWFWTFTYAGSYALHDSWGQGIYNLHTYLHAELEVYLGFLVLVAAGLPLAVRHKAFQNRVIFGTGFLLFSFLGTAAGFYFRNHYFILLLPALSLVVGMAVVLLESSLPPAVKRVPSIIFAGIVAGDIYLQAGPFFQVTPRQLCQTTYGGNPFAAALPVAQYLRENSPPDARIAVIGSEPEIYFYSRRHSATGYIYMYPLMESQPYALTMQHEMMGEITVRQPEFLVLVMNRFSWMAQPGSDYTIVNWGKHYAAEFYDPVGIIGQGPDDKIIQGAGDEVNRLGGQLQQPIIVFKRKPDIH